MAARSKKKPTAKQLREQVKMKRRQNERNKLAVAKQKEILRSRAREQKQARTFITELRRRLADTHHDRVALYVVYS